jgi:hypothetical protein
MKTAQHFKGLRHGLGIKIAVTKNALAQPSNFTVLVKRNQSPTAQFGNTEPD